MRLRNIVSVLVGFLTTGCASVYNGDATIAKSPSTYAVVVGMETSQFAGKCAGAGIDAQRMKSLIGKYTDNIVYLRDGNATKNNVVSAIRNSIEKSSLFILYYSGHGGQEAFPDTGSDETDGKDEFLCLYDTYLRDNEIWDMIKDAKCRVFLVFDACHSETMFRGVSPFFLRRCVPLAETHNSDLGIDLLVWSGCPEETYSYGSATGGMMTNAILKYFDPGKTYDSLWKQIESDKSLRAAEIVQRTISGNGFTDAQMFR